MVFDLFQSLKVSSKKSRLIDRFAYIYGHVKLTHLIIGIIIEFEALHYFFKLYRMDEKCFHN